MAKLLVNLDVPALEPAIRFYVEAFDLKVGRRFDDAFAELLGAEAPIYLLVKKPGSKPHGSATEGRTYSRHWTPVHLDFVVQDIEASVARAVKAGATVEKPVTDAPYGKLAVLADPFGHGVCFVQFNARGYDALLP